MPPVHHISLPRWQNRPWAVALWATPLRRTRGAAQPHDIPKACQKHPKTIGVVSNHPAFKSFSKRSCSRLSAPLCWGPLKGSTSCLRCCRSWLITVTSDFPRISFQIFYLCRGSVFRGKLFRGVVFQSTHAMMSCLRRPENLTLLRMHLQLVPGQHEVVSPARFMMIGILYMAQDIGATINPQHGSKWTKVAGHQPFCRLKWRIGVMLAGLMDTCGNRYTFTIQENPCQYHK